MTEEWYSGSSSEEEEEERVWNTNRRGNERKKAVDSEDEWEEVGAKQKKKKQMKERKKEEEKSGLLRDARGNLISKEKEKFLREYAQLSSNQFTTGSFYDHIQNLEDPPINNAKKKGQQKKTSDKNPSRHLIDSKGEFIGEQLEFRDLSSKPTKQGKSKKTNNSSSSSKSSSKGIKEIASSINIADLKSYLRGCHESDEGDQMPFKLLADYLENLFATGTGPYTTKENLSNPELPFSLLSKEAQRELQETIQHVNESSLDSFFWYLIQRLIPFLKKSSSPKGVGIEILIQAIIRSKPSCVVKNQQNLKEYFTKQQVLTKSATPFLLWMFSQITDHSLALSQWFQFLLPVLFDTSQTEYHPNIISFVNNLIRSRSSASMDESTATMAYERLMLYKASGKEIPKDLKDLFPRLMDKKFLFPSSNGSVPKKFFTMLLGHSATEKEALRDEVLPALVQCLESDNTFFSVWEEAYPKYIAQSSNLLLYITHNWENKKMYQKISAEQVLSLCQKFVQINKTLKKGKSKLSAEANKEVDMCNATCKLLKTKLKEFGEKKGSIFCNTVISLGVLAAGVAVYLIKCQNGACNQFIPYNI